MEDLKKKQFLTYDEQITFLEEKKRLMISDKEYAKKILLKIGYFPLINGYKEVFKQSINDQFQKGTTFEDIYELYSFDNELRNIFLKYILMAERNIKSSLSYHFCKEYGDLQSDYLSVNNYDYTGKKKNVINKMVKIMSGQLRYDSDYVYIRHYMTTYQYVPLWVLMNVLTIGQLSKIYASQKGRIQIKVCQDFGPLKVNEMGKMLADDAGMAAARRTNAGRFRQHFHSPAEGLVVKVGKGFLYALRFNFIGRPGLFQCFFFHKSSIENNIFVSGEMFTFLLYNLRI